MVARILNKICKPTKSRKLYKEILAILPLLFEAPFENDVLMDRLDEGNAVIERVEKALEVTRFEQNGKSTRDVRLIMMQIKYLLKRVDEALVDFEELIMEDPKDYMLYFCQGVILIFLGKNKEAGDKFAKCKELASGKFDVGAYLQSLLSRVRLVCTEDSEI